MTTETNKVLSHFSATPEILAFALECANDAVYIYDDNRRIYYSNPRASQMTGYTPAELACMSVADIDPTYSFPDRATVLERARLGTRVLIETADGKGERWTTVGVSANIIDASFQALIDSITYRLVKSGAVA